MCSSVSCAAFEAFSSFLEWVVCDRSGSANVVHYLDGFLFMGPAGSKLCHQLLATFQANSKELGVPLAQEKTEEPINKLTFLGIELDTVAQCSRLPPDKLDTLRALLERALSARKLTLRDIQELVGHLNFACRLVAPR